MVRRSLWLYNTSRALPRRSYCAR